MLILKVEKQIIYVSIFPTEIGGVLLCPFTYVHPVAFFHNYISSTFVFVAHVTSFSAYLLFPSALAPDLPPTSPFALFLYTEHLHRIIFESSSQISHFGLLIS